MDELRPKLVGARVQRLEGELIVYADPSLVVVRKPAGISTVPFGDEPADEMTLDALVRANPEAAYDYAELGRMAAEAPAATTPQQ